ASEWPQLSDGRWRHPRPRVRCAAPGTGLCDLCHRGEGPGRLATVRPASGTPFGVIEASVIDGMVTLDGAVPSLSHKRLAGVLARWVPGSRDVINGLGVEPPGEDSDDEITDAVRLVLEKDRFVRADQICVRTRQRVVTLEGVVPNDSIREMAEFDA